MNVHDDSSPKTPFSETGSHESFMEYVQKLLWKAEEYDNWIGPLGTDEWYLPAEFLEKFSERRPDYHLFFHNSKRKKPMEILQEMLAEYQLAHDHFKMLIYKPSVSSRTTN